MLVNRTRRRKKFLELAIWEVFYRRKRGLMNVDKQYVLQQLCSVSVDFQQFEGSLLKKTQPSSFIWKEDVFSHLE